MSNRERNLANRQPISAAAHESALLTLPTVLALTGFGKTKIYSEMKKGNFPMAIRQGVRCTRWRAGEVTNWLNQVGVEVK